MVHSLAMCPLLPPLIVVVLVARRVTMRKRTAAISKEKNRSKKKQRLSLSRVSGMENKVRIFASSAEYVLLSDGLGVLIYVAASGHFLAA